MKLVNQTIFVIINNKFWSNYCSVEYFCDIWFSYSTLVAFSRLKNATDEKFLYFCYLEAI